MVLEPIFVDVDDDEVILEPSDAPDFNWSPVQ